MTQCQIPQDLHPGQHRCDNHKYPGFQLIFSFVIIHLYSCFLYNFGLITYNLLSGFYALPNFSDFTFLFRFRFLDRYISLRSLLFQDLAPRQSVVPNISSLVIQPSKMKPLH